MKRALSLIITFTLALFGCSGCRDLNRASVPNEQAFVSAVGFDNEDGEWLFSVKIASVGEESSRVLIARGDRITSAFENIVAGSVGELNFTHCRAIVLGKSVMAEALSEVIRFCADKLEIPLSSRMIAVDNASEILSFKTDGNGYEISDIADKTAKKLGFGAHAAVYEIETARIQSISLFALPRFTADGKLQMTGLTVYKDDIPTAQLDMAESRVYALLRNVFEGGEINHGGESENLRSASSKINCSFSEDTLYIDITIRSNPKSELLIEEVKAILSEYDTDLFGIEGQIEGKNPEIYGQIKNDYEQYYKNAKFTVREE